MVFSLPGPVLSTLILVSSPYMFGQFSETFCFVSTTPPPPPDPPDPPTIRLSNNVQSSRNVESNFTFVKDMHVLFSSIHFSFHTVVKHIHRISNNIRAIVKQFRSFLVLVTLSLTFCTKQRGLQSHGGAKSSRGTLLILFQASFLGP